MDSFEMILAFRSVDLSEDGRCSCLLLTYLVQYGYLTVIFTLLAKSATLHCLKASSANILNASFSLMDPLPRDY
jgi:hypothetical protein